MTAIEPYLEKRTGNAYNATDSTLSLLDAQLVSSDFSIGNRTKIYHLMSAARRELEFDRETTLYCAPAIVNNYIDNVLNRIQAHFKTNDNFSGVTLAYRSERIGLSKAIKLLQNALADACTEIPIQDVIHFHYARNGEALLNQELSRLSDALNDAKHFTKHLNRLESVLAINPGKGFINERGELLIVNNGFPLDTATDAVFWSRGAQTSFYNRPEFAQFENVTVGGVAKVNSAIDTLKDASYTLENSMGILPTDSDTYQTIKKVVDLLRKTYVVGNWNNTNEYFWADREGGDSSKGELYWKTFDDIALQPKTFARLFMDQNFRKYVADALSALQSQNDVQKQVLSKALFLYQEFIKSSAALLDMTFKSSKSIAQKIAR